MGQLIFTVSAYSRYRHIIIPRRIGKKDLLGCRVHGSDNIHITPAPCANRTIYVNTADINVKTFILYIYLRCFTLDCRICIVLTFNAVLGNDLYPALEILINLIQDSAITFVIDNCLDTAVQKSSRLLI